MLWPMAVLAVGSLVLGAALGPTGRLEHYFEAFRYMPAPEHGEHDTFMLFVSSAIALAGLGFAWWTVAIRLNSAALGAPVEAVAKAGVNRFYLDEIYSALIVKPMEGISRFIAGMDVGIIDEFWRTVVEIPQWLGNKVRQVQSGGVTNYAAIMAIIVVLQ
jgi:NADH-quinone oxidoreductase subunit L